MYLVIPLVAGLAVGFVFGYFKATRKFPWD